MPQYVNTQPIVLHIFMHVIDYVFEFLIFVKSLSSSHYLAKDKGYCLSEKGVVNCHQAEDELVGKRGKYGVLDQHHYSG